MYVVLGCFSKIGSCICAEPVTCMGLTRCNWEVNEYSVERSGQA